MRVERGISIESIETIDSTDTTQEVEFKTNDGRSFRQQWQFENVDADIREDINEVIENNNPGAALSLLETSAVQTSGTILGREQDIATEGLKDFFAGMVNKWQSWKNDPKRQLRKKDGIFKSNNQIRKVILNTLLNDSWLDRVTISERDVLANKFLPLLDCGGQFNQDAPLSTLVTAVDNMNMWLDSYKDAMIKYISALIVIYEYVGSSDISKVAKEYAKVDIAKYMLDELYKKDTNIANNNTVKFDKEDFKVVMNRVQAKVPQTVRPLTKEELKEAGRIMLDLIIMPELYLEDLIPYRPSTGSMTDENGGEYELISIEAQAWDILFGNLYANENVDLDINPYWASGRDLFKALSAYVDASIA